MNVFRRRTIGSHHGRSGPAAPFPAASCIPAIATDTLSGNALSPSNWYQAYLEMQRRASTARSGSAGSARCAARAAARQDAIPLGVLHFEYQAVRPDAVENG